MMAQGQDWPISLVIFPTCWIEVLLTEMQRARGAASYLPAEEGRTRVLDLSDCSSAGEDSKNKVNISR